MRAVLPDADQRKDSKCDGHCGGNRREAEQSHGHWRGKAGKLMQQDRQNE